MQHPASWSKRGEGLKLLPLSPKNYCLQLLKLLDGNTRTLSFSKSEKIACFQKKQFEPVTGWRGRRTAQEWWREAATQDARGWNSARFVQPSHRLLLPIHGCHFPETPLSCLSSEVSEHLISLLKLLLSSESPCNWHKNSATAQWQVSAVLKTITITPCLHCYVLVESYLQRDLFPSGPSKRTSVRKMSCFTQRLKPVLSSAVLQWAAWMNGGEYYTHLGRGFLCSALASCPGFPSGEEEMQNCPVINFLCLFVFHKETWML